MFSTLAFVLIFLALVTRQLHSRPQFCFAVTGDDSDMKIVGEKVTMPAARDRSDEAAAEYLREKTNGNIDRAKKLGGDLAEMMTKACDTADSMPSAALIFFAVLQAIEEYCPTLTAADTVRTTMFDTVKAANADVYEQINDPAAFSLFILTSRGEQTATYGDIYAKCYKMEGDPDKIKEGNDIFRRWNEIAGEAVKNAAFQK